VIDSTLARRIRLVALDVDGVLTDAGVYVGMAGDRAVELKRFDIQDGVGVYLLRAAGIRVAIVSGRFSQATAMRAAELGIEDVVQDDRAIKLPAFEELLRQHGIEQAEAAFVGDDLPDLPVLERVALPVAVANAVPEVLAVARYTTAARGGHGAVREFAEALLKARGAWEQAVDGYLAERNARRGATKPPIDLPQGVRT
jgi:3-deoxy-D-manno-octulosonate 8-phosphate phosphatase (KDO 8-P phosphatase)